MTCSNKKVLNRFTYCLYCPCYCPFLGPCYLGGIGPFGVAMMPCEGEEGGPKACPKAKAIAKTEEGGGTRSPQGCAAQLQPADSHKSWLEGGHHRGIGRVTSCTCKALFNTPLLTKL